MLPSQITHLHQLQSQECHRTASEIFLFGLLTAPVINTKIKSDLGKERFTPACRLQSVSEGKQGRNSRQEVKAETIPWLTALPRDSTAHGGLGTSISNHEANLRRQYLK